jgi:exosortase A
MTTRISLAPNGLDDIWRDLGVPVTMLALGVALLGLLFHTEAAAAVQTWIDSTAYSHCFFVIPIAAYLAWERRQMVAGIPIVPMPAAVLLVLPLSFVWLVAERVGIMEGRQLVAMTILEVLFAAVLGWRMFRVLAAPLLYLFFLVPFGAFVTPALQNFTAGFIDIGLSVLGIPHYSNDYVIEIPAGSFYVAEACAGLRFLIASIAFGVLYSLLIYRSMARRLSFLAASIIIPIIANGFRALGIVVLGQVLGSAQAAAADHIIYGWVFFSVVLMLLILAGLPFREDMAQQARASLPVLSAAPSGRPLLVVGMLVAVAALGPAVAIWLNHAAQALVATPQVSFAIPPGCRAAPAGSAMPGTMMLDMDCPQGALTIMVQTFPPRSNPASMLVAQRLVTAELRAEDAVVSSLDVPGMEPPNWRYVATTNPAYTTATALWIDGRPAQGGLAERLIMARNSIFGSAHAPVLVSVSMRSQYPQMSPAEERRRQQFIGMFLQAQTTLPMQIERLSAEVLP